MSEHGEGTPEAPRPPGVPGHPGQAQQPPTPPHPGGQPTAPGHQAPAPSTPQSPAQPHAPAAPPQPQTPTQPQAPQPQAPQPQAPQPQAPRPQAPAPQAPPANPGYTAPPVANPGYTAPPTQAPATGGYQAPAGQAPPVQAAAPYGAAPAPKKKSKAPIIGGAIAAVALVGGGAFVALSGGDGDDTATAAPETTVAVATTVAPAESVDEAADPAPADAAPPSVSDLAQSSVQIILLSDDGTPLCSGSGTFVNADGTILTNAHVVASDVGCPFSRIGIAVTTDSGLPPELRYEADLLVVDNELDLAVVRVARTSDGGPTDGLAFPALPIGDSDAVEIGDQIRILGYPSIGGDTITFTNGSVSGFTAQAGVSDRSWIKTDATISGGNSGGTAVDDEGLLVGVPTQAAASQDGPIVDCRVITDTNGDGRLDADDQCVPIGGFLNGLRPINLAKPLIEQAATASPMELEDNTPVVPAANVDTSNVRFFRPGFSPGIAEPESDTQFVVTAEAGIESICTWFNWEGFSFGAAWDAVWRVDGEIVEEYSFLGEIWEGPESGNDYWLCAIDDDAGGLDAGLYEMVFFVEGELVFSESILITPAPVTVHEIEFINELGEEVCFLRINPLGSADFGLDELGASQTILPGESATVFLPEGDVIAQAENCAGEPIGGDANGILIDGPEPITMTPPG